MELVSNPALLLCDEVTSGLDPASEDDIVRLLHGLSRRQGRLVLSVTHSLAHLDLYDSVLVLYKGVTAYQGPPGLLAHYFGVDHADQLYNRLALREPEDWAASWAKHRAALSEAADALETPSRTAEPVGNDTAVSTADGKPGEPSGEQDASDASDASDESTPPSVPGITSQFATLLARRLRVFLRSPSGLGLQLGLVLGFPFLVAIFAWNGLPNVMQLSMEWDIDLFDQLREARDFLVHSSRVGSLVSGIVMFQVILLTLMGANNSGREIASERAILEKEKLAGLHPLAYVASKAVFLLGLVAIQSLWMGFFVHHVCGFPGEFPAQLLFLFLVNAAMTSICLAISSLMRTAEQASLVSIYLVGFQLPLSGAVLALPELLGTIVRPFVSAYWSWSGILQTLKNERYYDIVGTVVQSPLSPPALCLGILAAHIAVGLLVAWIGCERRLAD
jgi:ABC transport system ATP-binding/permease protein